MNKFLIKTSIIVLPLLFMLNTSTSAASVNNKTNNIPSVIAEEQELFDNSIQIYAKAGLAKNYTYWEIKDEGYCFKLVPATDLKSWNLDTQTTFRIYDSNSKIIFDKTYNSGTLMKSIANDLSIIEMNYNYSFQIIPHKWETVLRIDGYIGNNIDNYNYAYGIDNFRASNCKFKLAVGGSLQMEKVNIDNLSFLDNRFEFESKNLSNTLKLVPYYNNYKLALTNVNGGLDNTVKSPFVIAIYDENYRYIGPQIYYKEISSGTTLEALINLLAKIPPIKKGQYIQFVPAGSNTPPFIPEFRVLGDIVNNINFYDYSKGFNSHVGSITAFQLTDNGLEVKEFTSLNKGF